MSERRPAYYKDIDRRFDSLETRQREVRASVDDILVHQAEQIKRMDQIHYLLAGTDYESENNGGLVGEVKRLKRKVSINTSWRIKLTAVGSAAMAVIGTILFKFGSILSTLKELITKQ